MKLLSHTCREQVSRYERKHYEIINKYYRGLEIFSKNTVGSEIRLSRDIDVTRM